MSFTPRLRATLWRLPPRGLGQRPRLFDLSKPAQAGLELQVSAPLREGATPVVRQSRFHGVPRLDFFVPAYAAPSRKD
jgi:hypothetical protein